MSRTSPRAYLAVLEAPRERVHDQAFNVGATAENYRVLRGRRSWSAEVVPGASVTFAAGASPDKRNYRVNCDKLLRAGAEPTARSWTLRRGIEQIYAAYRDQGLTEEEFLGPRYLRLRHLKDMMRRRRRRRAAVDDRRPVAGQRHRRRMSGGRAS